MPEQENIHACWSLIPQFDKATGKTTTAGLLALGGHSGDGALRELKKRCDAELEHAGKPLVGCAMYVTTVMSWVKEVLDHKERLKGTEIMVNYAADKSFRQGFERSFHVTGEDEIIDIIEETWAQYQKEEEIPDSVRMDVEEDIVLILEDEYCHVGLVPTDFTATEIELSKTLALGLGRRKRRKPTVKPPSGETPEERELETETINEPINEPPGETTVKTETEMRDEIRLRMKRA